MLRLLFDIIQFIHLDKHLDRAWDIFWIKKVFGPKQNFIFHAAVKKCHFQGWDGCSLLVHTSPQKLIITYEKLFLFWIPMNAKLESANYFRLNNSKITVCTKLSIHTVILVIILPRDLAPLFKRPNLEEDPLLTSLLYVIFSFDISTG